MRERRTSCVGARLHRRRLWGSIGLAAAAGERRGAGDRTGGAEPPIACNSLVWAGAHDWTNDATPIPGADQVIVHQFIDTVVHDSFWVQAVTVPTTAGTPVTVSDTGLVNDRWSLVAVEILGANP